MNFIQQLIDGGDDSLRNRERSPYDWRTTDRNSTAWYYKSFSGSQDSGIDSYYLKCESKESYGHPVRFLGRTNRNIGGNFVHTKLRLDDPPHFFKLRRDGSLWRESNRGVWSSGSLADLFMQPDATSYIQAQQRSTSKLPLMSEHDLDAHGSTAISRVAPTNPVVDLSTSLAELLREGLPQTPGTVGNVGGEYLNVMFGYIPLYGDLKDLRKTVVKADKLLRQYERDSGKWVRRDYEFPEDVSVTTDIQGNAALGKIPSGLSNLGIRHTQTTTRIKTWFEGVFTYYLPQEGWRRTVAELDRLYGIRPGVDTLWQLTGYSWLADYFSNIGDVFSNLNAFSADGLVMPYGYIMREQRKTVSETWFGEVWIGGQLTKVTVPNQYTVITHQRQLATPFGFGLSLDGLTGRQQSILVALGISRL